MIKYLGKLEYYLAALIVITLLNTFLGERFASTTLVSILIAFTVTYKGFVVIDHFMELKEGRGRERNNKIKNKKRKRLGIIKRFLTKEGISCVMLVNLGLGVNL